MFLNSIYAKRTEMALPVPTKSFLEMNPEPKNLSPKDFAGSDIMKLKVS